MKSHVQDAPIERPSIRVFAFLSKYLDKLDFQLPAAEPRPRQTIAAGARQWLVTVLLTRKESFGIVHLKTRIRVDASSREEAARIAVEMALPCLPGGSPSHISVT